MNHHTLSDFRCARVAVLEEMLTHSVAVLMDQGLVTPSAWRRTGCGCGAAAGGLVSPPLDFGGLPQEGPGASRSAARGIQVIGKPVNGIAKRRSGAWPRIACDESAKRWSNSPTSSGGGRRSRAEERHRNRGRAQKAHRAARLQHRSRGAGDEDGRRGLSTRLQRPVGDHDRERSHRGGRGVPKRKRFLANSPRCSIKLKNATADAEEWLSMAATRADEDIEYAEACGTIVRPRAKTAKTRAAIA